MKPDEGFAFRFAERFLNSSISPLESGEALKSSAMESQSSPTNRFRSSIGSFLKSSNAIMSAYYGNEGLTQGAIAA
ncbi:MAG: hypothetical protein ABIS50_06195 [Luteolibacter sp.]|uniref:hypothetical protein n=1 Tax=Luteolibacter sp. TaxID=1962973 RepID=UPI00326768E7